MEHALAKYNLIGNIPICISKGMIQRSVVLASFIALSAIIFLLLSILFFALGDRGKRIMSQYCSIFVSISVILIIGAFIYQHLQEEDAERSRMREIEATEDTSVVEH